MRGACATRRTVIVRSLLALAALGGGAALQLPGGEAVEQTAQGTRPQAALVESFDGLGVGFEGPQGTASLRNPSDNSLAVGPDHIVQTVNSRMAIFTKKGKRFEASGSALYGPVNTNNVFKGFGGACERSNNGDAVVRYDQIADRWLIVMPIFRRDPTARGAANRRSIRWAGGAQRSRPAGTTGSGGGARASAARACRAGGASGFGRSARAGWSAASAG